MNIANMVDYALKAVGPPVDQVYKRTTTTSGGNSLLGIYPTGTSTATKTDTLLSPQPVYSQLGDKSSQLNVNGQVLQATDYEITLSANSITIDELQQPSLTFVFKTEGHEEEFYILGFDPPQFQGSYCAFIVYARRKTST